MSSSDLSGKGASLPLLVPLLSPTFGAKGLEDFEVVLTLIATSGFDAAVIVDVVLPTIFRLVLIREPRIKLWGLEDYLGRL